MTLCRGLPLFCQEAFMLAAAAFTFLSAGIAWLTNLSIKPAWRVARGGTSGMTGHPPESDGYRLVSWIDESPWTQTRDRIKHKEMKNKKKEMKKYHKWCKMNLNINKMTIKDKNGHIERQNDCDETQNDHKMTTKRWQMTKTRHK